MEEGQVEGGAGGGREDWGWLLAQEEGAGAGDALEVPARWPADVALCEGTSGRAGRAAVGSVLTMFDLKC